MAITVASEPEILTWSHFREVETRWSDIVVADIKREITMPSEVSIVKKPDGQFALGDLIVTVKLDSSLCRVVKDQKSDALLAHEQGHLDLSKISARALAKDMEALRAPSGEKLSEKFQALLLKHGELLDKADIGYDDKTKGGGEKTVQAKWEASLKIAKASAFNNTVEGFPL